MYTVDGFVKLTGFTPRNNFLSGLKVRDEGARTC